MRAISIIEWRPPNRKVSRIAAMRLISVRGRAEGYPGCTVSRPSLSPGTDDVLASNSISYLIDLVEQRDESGQLVGLGGHRVLWSRIAATAGLRR
jgi:hypothetical protein